VIGKREVLRRFRKTVGVGADVTSRGRLFQRRLPEWYPSTNCQEVKLQDYSIFCKVAKQRPKG